MIFRGLDSNGDWTFGQGKSNYLTGNDAIGTNIATRIRSWIGDCFFDQNAGIDWLNRLSMKNQENLLKLDLQRIIQQSYGVTGIRTLTVSLVQRAFFITYIIDTINSASYQNQLKVNL